MEHYLTEFKQMRILLSIWGRRLVCLAVALMVSTSADAVDELRLPLGGVVTQVAPVYGTLDLCTDVFRRIDPYADLEIGRVVVVYELNRQCVRISPPGSDLEAWIPRQTIRLDPTLPQDTGYLVELRAPYREMLRDTVPTACGVVIRKSAIDTRERGYSERAVWAGRILKVYRTRPEAVQVSEVKSKSQEGWLPRRDFEVWNRFADDASPCTRTLSRAVRYRFVVDNAFYEGPSKNLPVRSFFGKGQTVIANLETPTEWLASSQGWFSKKWVTYDTFPIAGATSTSELRLRAGSTTASKVLYSFAKERSQLTLFAFRDGWYRVTPDGFQPEGWVSADFVEVLPSTAVGAERSRYYLEAIRPAPTAPPRPATRSGKAPQRSQPIGFLEGCFLGILLVLLLPALSAWMLLKALEDAGLEMDDDIAYWMCRGFVWVGAVLLFIPPTSWLGMVLLTLGYLPLIYIPVWLFHVVHYLVVRHPLERELSSAVREARPVDRERIADTFEELWKDLPPHRYMMDNRRRRAEKLRKMLDAEAKLFEELLGRERFYELKRKLGL